MRAALRRTRASNWGSLKSNTYRLRNIFCTSVRNQKTKVDMAPPHKYPRFLPSMAMADVQINASRPGGEYTKQWSALTGPSKGRGSRQAPSYIPNAYRFAAQWPK